MREGRNTIPKTHPHSSGPILRESEGTQMKLRKPDRRQKGPVGIFLLLLLWSTTVCPGYDAPGEVAEEGAHSKRISGLRAHTLSGHPSLCPCSCSFSRKAPLFCLVSSYSSLKTQLRHASSRKSSRPLFPKGRNKHLELTSL